MKTMLGIASVLLAGVAATNTYAAENPTLKAQSPALVSIDKKESRPLFSTRPTSDGSAMVVAFGFDDPSCHGIPPGGPNFWCTN